MSEEHSTGSTGMSRRDLLKMIGISAGSIAMYQAMSTLGFAAESGFKGPMDLGATRKKGTSVLVLGAGVAGMLAAYELKKAGYNVKILEFREKAGGRCWTLRGGDTYTELGGAVQKCEFDKGHYINPGPWRIPFHHHAVLDYCRQFGVKLDTFVQINHNAYLHTKDGFGGKPQRMGHVLHDFRGQVAELLSKASNTQNLDLGLTKEDTEKLLEAMKQWGALDKDYRYTKNRGTSMRRGYDKDPGGGLSAGFELSTPLNAKDLLHSKMWRFLKSADEYEYQSTLFQPTGGMDMFAEGFRRQVGDLITYNAKITKIEQNDKGVTVTSTDTKTSKTSQTSADWCVCTIPLSILSQMEVQVSSAMKSAIDAVPYETGFKIGVQYKRRFWEEDDRIYGGVTYTDTPINRISYPMDGLNQGGKGVLLNAYTFGPDSYKFTSLTPQERIDKTLELTSLIHPQCRKEFDNAISVGWHRVPWTNGCYGLWTEQSRAEHYKNLCQIDGRIVLAGEHASYIPAWLEGAVLSSMDAVKRLHAHIQA